MSIDNTRIINADPHGRITLQGYDPVAFHVDGKAMKGDPSIAAEYLEYRYLFSSDANKAMFEKQPEIYLPAYGGYCAYGVSIDVLAPVEIDTWEIIDGRVVLQFSQGAKQKFAERAAENIRKADDNWSRLEAQLDSESI
ncbi:YHS domain protein [bacterium]|nr:YHS domain protein [bacterium]